MAQTEDEASYFTLRDDTFVPESHARGWWAPGTLHGRLLGGLAARELERAHAEEGLHFARLTVDLFRTAPFAPVRVSTERVRDGRRIRVVDAVVHGERDGLPLARVSAVLLRTSTPPPGHIPATGPWDAPPPEQLPASHEHQHFWRFDEELQPVREWRGDQRRRAWLRETRPLVAGEALSPLVRVALAGDTASPLAHASDEGLQYINADYTLCLSRLPLSDAIGLEAKAHTAEDGIAVGHCTLYDAAGPIGYCATTAIANTAPPR
ncbi:thioesterase family protein [Streptomyces niger]|uniref:thioesterase family protein n=1 Tax=Streptomyces niger TaxID=66373 RepID=UPI00069B10EA|nr:thioesterase family protein [Streptomyces niger]